MVTKECLEKGGWTNSDDGLTKVPDKLWRTLVADRTIGGENLRPCKQPPLHIPGKRTEGNGRRNHSFVGEAYIYGRMDGEVINVLGEQSLVDKTVEFGIV